MSTSWIEVAYSTHIAPCDVDSIRVQGKCWDFQVHEQVVEKRFPVKLEGCFKWEPPPRRGGRRFFFPAPFYTTAIAIAAFASSEAHVISGVCHDLLLAVDICFYRDVPHSYIKNVVQVDSPVGRVLEGDVLDHKVVTVVNIEELRASLIVLRRNNENERRELDRLYNLYVYS